MTKTETLRSLRRFTIASCLVLVAASCSGTDGAPPTPPSSAGSGGGLSGAGGSTTGGNAGSVAPTGVGGATGGTTVVDDDAGTGLGAAGGVAAGGAGSGGTGGSGSGGSVVPPRDAGVVGIRMDASTRDAARTVDATAPSPATRDAAPVDQAQLPPTTLYLAGDSTVMTYTSGPLVGWGQVLPQFFISKVTIVNRAIGGRSIQTWNEGAWAGVLSAIKAGDYLMIDFGINDSGGTADRAVTPANFKTILGTMVDETRAKQATAMPVTPTALQYWSNGMETNARLAPYCTAMKQVGTEKGILVADLNQASVDLLNRIGQTAAMQIYSGGDKAHFTEYGATEMAKLLVAELRRINSPLANYLK